MLEDSTMEKKATARTAANPGKGNNVDVKKSQDGQSTKQFPKTNRRREPPGSGFSSQSKYDPTRKPAPQKVRAFDKRPRPRAQQYGGSKEGGQITSNDTAEYGSVFSPGSKKQNLNHLLNFHYNSPRGTGGGAWHTFGVHKFQSRPRYNKEHFLQATCQFVVKASKDYTAYLTDPDLLVDWDLIEQIRVCTPEVPSCPICLYPPVAAKMTRCGHIYCWSCILHYLALSDKTWRKCPICFEAIHKGDLKSVVAVPKHTFCVGNDITLVLMQRERGSLLPVPVNQAITLAARSSNCPLDIDENALNTTYSKLLTATPYQVFEHVLQRERSELELQLLEDKECPEVCFIQQALEMLVERECAMMEESKEKINNTTAECKEIVGVDKATTPLSSDHEVRVYSSAFDDEFEIPDLSNSRELEGPDQSRIRHESLSSEGVYSEDGEMESIVLPEDIEILSPPGATGNSLTASQSKIYYFYQAVDGQQVYMHSLNARMLEREYGSLQNSPPIIYGQIIEKESSSMSSELRRKIRCLQHLPIATPFEVVEIGLQPPVVTRETLFHFQDQLVARSHRRQKRAREERKRERRIQQEEGRQWGCALTETRMPRIRINSRMHFPDCGIQETHMVPSAASSPSPANSSQATSPSASVETLCEQLNTLDTSPQGSVISDDASLNCGPSFAQMLRQGKSRQPPIESSQNAQMKATSFPVRTVSRRQSDSEPEPEDYISAPKYHQSFSEAFALAMEQAASSKKETSNGKSEQPSLRKKTKKQKQKVLFTTARAFTGK